MHGGYTNLIDLTVEFLAALLLGLLEHVLECPTILLVSQRMTHGDLERLQRSKQSLHNAQSIKTIST